MQVELGFDNSLALVDIERLELRIARFTDADYGNVWRYDLEITFGTNTCRLWWLSEG